MKNKILTAVLLCLLPFILSGCTLSELPVIGKYLGGGGVSSKPITLNVWGLWENQEVIDSMISKYQELRPNVTINYDARTIMGAAKYKETVVTRLSEGGAPDIIFVHNSWVPYIKDKLAPSNSMTQQEFSQTFYEAASESAVVDGQVYAAPVYYDGLVLAYNKKHFEEINQSTPPTSWEEFRRLALSLTQKSADDTFVRAGAAIGSANNIDFFSDIMGLMFAQAGVSIPDDLESKSAQDAVKFYTTFVLEDKVWSPQIVEASTTFAEGKVSMIFTTTWNLLDIIRANPGLDIGVAPIPQALPDTPISWASFWMYAVPKDSVNVAAAWDFIKFLVADEQQLAIFDKASTVRAFGAPYSSTALASQASSGVSAKYIMPVLETASFAKSGIFTGRSGNTFQTEALKETINFILSEGPEETAEALTILKAKLVTGQ